MAEVYCVIEFVEEGSIAIVPSIWLSSDGNLSYWPPYNNNTQNQNAAKRCETPQNTWKTFAIKEWARCKSWDEANKQLGRLEITSNLDSTDVEDRGRSKRKKISLKRCRDISSSSNSSPIPFQKATKHSHKSSKKSRLSFNPPPAPSLTESTSSDVRTSDDEELPIMHSTPSTINCRVLEKRLSFSGISAGTQSARKGIARSNSRDEDRTHFAHQLEPVLHKIFEILERMKSEMKTLRKAMEKRDEKKYASISSGCFPLKSFEEIEEFERKALDSAYADDVVNMLLALNGRSLAETTRNMLSAVFSNEMAASYNLSGKGLSGRKGFQFLRLYKIIFTASDSGYWRRLLRKAHTLTVGLHLTLAALRQIHTDASDHSYRDVIVHWLDGARDRNGGRKKRTSAVTDPSSSLQKQ